VTGHQWFWDNSSIVPYEAVTNGILFNSTGYLYLDPLTVVRGDPFFKSANMVRIENEYNFLSWPCIEDSIVQSNFKNSTIKWIFKQYNTNSAYFDEYFGASSSYEDSKICLLQYFEIFDINKLKTPHVENWEEFLSFINYCYTLDLFGFRHHFMEEVPHFVHYVNKNFEFQGELTYILGDYGCEFYFDHFIVENNPFFALDSAKLYAFDGAVVNMESGAMIYLDSTPLLHETTLIHNWHFGLLSENFPLQSVAMYDTLASDIVNYHYPRIMTEEEKKELKK